MLNINEDIANDDNSFGIPVGTVITAGDLVSVAVSKYLFVEICPLIGGLFQFKLVYNSRKLREERMIVIHDSFRDMDEAVLNALAFGDLLKERNINE